MNYSIYALIDPSTARVRYVGLTKNTKLRFKQHIRTSPSWIEALRQQSLNPVLNVVERTETLEQARKAEKRWIQHFEAEGHILENFVHNRVAWRERYRIAEWARQDAEAMARYINEGVLV